MPKSIVPSASLAGAFQQIIYSPDGGMEGALVDLDGSIVQLVVDKHDEAAGGEFAGIRTWQRITAFVIERAPSDKGLAEQPVYMLSKLLSVI